MKPLKHNILIKLNQNQETTTASGFVLDVKKEELQNNGVVTHIGSEVTDINVNDTVYFNRNNATSLTLEGIEYVVIKDTDVLVTLD